MRLLATNRASLATGVGDGMTELGILVMLFLMVLVDIGSCSANIMRVGQGEDVIFMCSTSDSIASPHYVVWHKGHKSVSKMGSRFFVNPTTGSLTIADVVIEDEGNYTCSAGWGQRFEPYTITLIVSIAPNIRVTSTNPVTPHVLETLTVSCQATGRPPPNVIWYSSKQLPIDSTLTQPGSRFSITESQSGETSLDSVLVIKPVFAEDRGSFVCKAFNVVGSSQDSVVVDVQRKPTMLSPLEDILVYWWEGHKVNLTCQSVGNPAPILKWTSFDDLGNTHQTPLSPMVDVKNGIVVSSSIWLPLKESFHMAATYKCKAENMYGMTPIRRFDVKRGYAPNAPVVRVLSIKDDEVILSINIYMVQDTPPVKYVTAHYHLEEAFREMEMSTTFTGNGTRLVLRGIMLFYRYIIKVKATNMVGESPQTVMKLYSKEKLLTSTTTPSIVVVDDQTDDPEQVMGPNETNADTSNGGTSDKRAGSNSSNKTDSQDKGRTLQSVEGNNSWRLCAHSWIYAVISLCCCFRVMYFLW